MTKALVKGFSDPIQQSQQVFRFVMKAMSEPGIVTDLPVSDEIQPLDSASFGCVLALLDNSTSLWLSPEIDLENIRTNLHFHTGVPFAKSPSECQFVLAFGNTVNQLDQFPKGTAEYPEGGATLLLLVNAINTGEGTTMTLSGPGIPQQRALQINGISAAIKTYLTERPDEFPCGLDIVFCCGQQLVCIPRSTQVAIAAEDMS